MQLHPATLSLGQLLSTGQLFVLLMSLRLSERLRLPASCPKSAVGSFIHLLTSRTTALPPAQLLLSVARSFCVFLSENYLAA